MECCWQAGCIPPLCLLREVPRAPCSSICLLSLRLCILAAFAEERSLQAVLGARPGL